MAEEAVNLVMHQETRGQKYEGKACSRCGGTLRYRTNQACVVCTRAASKASVDRRKFREMQATAEKCE